MSASRTGQTSSGSTSGTSTTTPNVPGFLTNPVNEVAWDIERLAQDNSTFMNGPSSLQNLAYHDAAKLGTSPVVDRVGGGQVNAFDQAGRYITGAVSAGANTAGNAALASSTGYQSTGYKAGGPAQTTSYQASGPVQVQGYKPAQASSTGYAAAGAANVSGYTAQGYNPAAAAQAQGYTAQGYNPAAAAQAQGYTAQQAKAAQLGPASTYQAALINDPIKVAAAQAQASSLLQGLPQYLSPYTQNVVDTTLASYDQNAARQKAAMDSAAGRDRAFGGSGYALREGVYAADSALGRAQTEAGLRDTAFNTAAGLSNLDAQRRTDVSQSNADLRTNAAIQAAGLNLTRNQSNQDATNSARAFGADARNQFATTQAGFNQQTNLDNAQRRDAAAALLANAKNTSALDFAGRKDAAGAQLAGAKNAASQFLAGAKNTSALDFANRKDAAGSQLADSRNAAAQFLAGSKNTAALDLAGRKDAASQFGASAKNTASMFNTGQQNDALSQLMQSRLTAGLDYAGRKDQAGQFAAQAKNTSALDYAGRNDAASQFGAAARNQAAQFGAASQNQASQFNAASRNNMAQFNAGQQDLALQRQLQGAGLMQGLGNDLLSNERANIALQATLGAQQRDIANQQTQEDYIRAQMLSQMLGNLPFNQFSGSTTTTQGRTSGQGGGSQVGAGLGDIGTLLALFSDERLKREIQTEGYDAKGRRWVSWRYIWDATKRHFGVIAQELLQTDPEAVMVHPSGYLMVDYGKVL